jgi:tetraacyldisaccharide 4'-kinase
LPIKSYFEDLMYGRKSSPLWGAILYVLSLLYRTSVQVRHWLFRFHVLRSRALPCTVISVGNVTLGGTGKTPAVISITALMLKNHKRPAVVSRGYGREDESEILVVSDGRMVLHDTRRCGDEPVLIGSKLPGVPVVVGRDRYRAALAAMQQFNADTVILDDGFQHLGLKRTCDVVLIDANNPFGNGKLFPAGVLREPISALGRAHAVLITNAGSAESTGPLKAMIRQHTNALIFTSHRTPLDLIDCCSGETKPLSVLRGTRVLAFSGIAQPASFISLLRSFGAVIAGEITYPDHYDFKKSDLASIFEKAADKKASMIITTEKDVVRLKSLKPDGIWTLRVELTVDQQEAWEAFLRKTL